MDQDTSAQVKNFDVPSDAGLKMASANCKPLASTTHELKIMDVEGGAAVAPDSVEEVETPMVIVVDDDEGEENEHPMPDDAGIEDIMDDEHAPLVAELQSALNNPDDKASEDPLLEDQERDPDTMSTKTEPSSDAESNHSYHDPMGLLERIDNHDPGDSQDDDDDDDESSNGGGAIGSMRRKMPRAQRWLLWMKRWPWILHEASDGTLAFCLYCNMTINVNNRSRHIQQHNMSLYHQERECNYLAFKKSEEQTRGATSDNEVKHEFGTKSYVAAMKQKRVSETEAFNNFNWLRWLRWHPWLERSHPTGTIGTCRVCNVRMNVEFVYLRKRHETTKGHMEALRNMDSDKPSRKRKRSKSNSETAGGDDEAEQEKEKESEPEVDPEAAQDTTVVMMNGEVDSGDDPSKWCELIPDTNPQQCRCTICDCTMAITSFLRHCKTRVHCHNLLAPAEKGSSDIRGIWAMFADLHPWLIADPEDPSIGYCSVCRKRFMYGNSEIKRKNHENSEKHTLAVAAAKAAIGVGLGDGNDGEMDEGDKEEEEVEASEAQSEARSESEGIEDNDDDNWSETQKTGKGFAIEPRKAKIRAGVRFYPWLCYSKDRKTQICKFCRVRFHNESAKARHEFSARHVKLVKQFKVRQAKLSQVTAASTRNKRQDDEESQEQDEEDGEEEDVEEDEQSYSDSGTVQARKPARSANKLFVKPIPATMKGKVMVWKGRFPWLSYKKTEQRGNYAWCKLCEVSLYLPTSKWASKHQRTSRHIRLRIDRKRNNGGNPVKTTNKNSGEISAVVATASALASGEARQKAAMAELQAKYNWLDPDANDENHCHCRVCDTRLPIKVFYLRQHDSSRKHAENLERHRANAAAAANAPSVSTTSTVDAERQEFGLDKESENDMSVRSDGSTAEPPAKRSRRSMEVRRIIRALRDSMGKRRDEPSHMDMARDMICSSFDIVSRLRTLEREAAAHNESTVQALQTVTVTPGKPPEPRHVLDLFFDSISPTMKSLPPDLAAEGKSKIMQLVCGLELRAMQRNATAPNTATVSVSSTLSTPASVTPVTTPPAPTSDPIATADVDMHSTCITILDDDNTVQNNNEVEVVQNKPASGTSSTQVTINGSPKDLPANIRRILSSNQMQVTNRFEADPVRCVPLDKLTTQSRVNGNGRLSQGGSSEAPSTPQADKSNGNTLAMLRQIRVNNNNSSKMITITKTPQTQQQHQPQGSMTSTPIMRGVPNSNGSQLTTFRSMVTHNRRP
ncbi:protein suppressor of variegation 3-7 isoform X2 [Drosophila santomea]|uniref:protein suppressor of variegation 3-7 isoform X2 n=1 Tax=Drosophila santomea TaxID=129105 RepID=UPI001954892E|nr:protein suppressor of variegation 3-7 isoform X2 [Drosophila santomea]